MSYKTTAINLLKNNQLKDIDFSQHPYEVGYWLLKLRNKSLEKLSDTTLIPPLNVFMRHSREWKDLESKWHIPLEFSDGRKKGLLNSHRVYTLGKYEGTSLFSPALCEVIYSWYLPTKGSIVDPFCGDITRGYVAHKLGYDYTGIDIRQEQINSNTAILPDVEYICSNAQEFETCKRFNLLFTSPPYWYLEKYSNLHDDLSNALSYDDFLNKYKSIMRYFENFVSDYIVLVVGDIRSKKDGFILPFVNDSENLFSSFKLWNRVILYGNASAHLRAKKPFYKSKIITNVYQTVLIFKRQNPLKPL